MNRFKDLTGKRFGRLVALSVDHFQDVKRGRRTFWKCKCDCGNIKVIRSDSLISGNTTSCGCFDYERRCKPDSIKKHKLYRVYWAMKDRCYKPTSKVYKWYGGRGIKICQEWLDSYESFYNWCMENGYKEGLTLDRINVNGNYEPDNCRLITQQEQANNTTRNRIITFNGESLNIVQWATKLDININTLYARLVTNNWSIERALTEPVK